MITLFELFKVNDDWSDNSFVNVFSVSEFLESDSEYECPRLTMRAALALYGEKEVYRFSGDAICVD